MRIIDITRPLWPGMPVWPGDAECVVDWTSRLERGDAANVAVLQLSAHTGTHAEGKLHVLPGGPAIGALPLDPFIGPARLVALPPSGALDEPWAAAVLESGAGERLLVRTGCWREAAGFPADYPAPTPGAARMLAEAGLRLYGTDAPSVDSFTAADLEVHRVLCGAGVAILENLLLDGAPPGTYELIALPLRLEAADASPVRAILRCP